MKALPKRKGNGTRSRCRRECSHASMKALPKRKGNAVRVVFWSADDLASMKAPPKRQGKVEMSTRFLRYGDRLNESPFQKEGKSTSPGARVRNVFGPQ